MAQVVLVGKDWHSRTLLRAQLIEEGLDVQAYESVRAALDAIRGDAPLPALLVADLFASGDPVNEIGQLAQWARRLPVWIIAGRNLVAEKRLKGCGFEMILFRPVDVGELVEQIKRRVGL